MQPCELGSVPCVDGLHPIRAASGPTPESSGCCCCCRKTLLLAEGEVICSAVEDGSGSDSTREKDCYKASGQEPYT